MTERESNNTYEQNFERLQSLVSRLEGEELGLQESLELFESGMELANLLDRQLAAVEDRVKVLVRGSESLETRGELPLEQIPVEKESEMSHD